MTQKLKIRAPSFSASLSVCLSPEILTLKEVFQISSHGKFSIASPASPLCISLICSTFPHPATHPGPLPPSSETLSHRAMNTDTIFLLLLKGKCTQQTISTEKKENILKCQFLFPDHDVAINRYSRLSKKRDNDKVEPLPSEMRFCRPAQHHAPSEISSVLTINS